MPGIRYLTYLCLVARCAGCQDDAVLGIRGLREDAARRRGAARDGALTLGSASTSSGQRALTASALPTPWQDGALAWAGGVLSGGGTQRETALSGCNRPACSKIGSRGGSPSASALPLVARREQPSILPQSASCGTCAQGIERPGIRAGYMSRPATLMREGEAQRRDRKERTQRAAWPGNTESAMENAVPAHDVRREPCPTSPTTETRQRQEPEIAQEASVAACIYEENKASSVRGGHKVVPHWNREVRCLVTQVYLSPVQQSRGLSREFHFFAKIHRRGKMD
jgi:hypothetical protein